MITIDKEKIGAEYIVLADSEENKNTSHGEVKNYKKDIDNNKLIITFDYMNSTDYHDFTIQKNDVLKIKSEMDSGNTWVKITQGQLWNSKIQKVPITNNKEMTIDLSQWKDGEIVVWVVVENGKDGLIQIEHIEN